MFYLQKIFKKINERICFKTSILPLWNIKAPHKLPNLSQHYHTTSPQVLFLLIIIQFNTFCQGTLRIHSCILILSCLCAFLFLKYGREMTFTKSRYALKKTEHHQETSFSLHKRGQLQTINKNRVIFGFFAV